MSYTVEGRPIGLAGDRIVSPTQAICLGVVSLYLFSFITRHFIVRASSNPKGLPFPPGPTGVPFFGNSLQLPRSKLWVKFFEWTIYGDIVGISLMGKKAVVLNTYETASQLLNRRGAIYSSRPVRILTTKYGGQAGTVSTSPYNESVVLQRKLMNQFFGPGPVKSYNGLLTKHARLFASWTLENPSQFQFYTRLAGTANIIDLMFGEEVTPQKRIWLDRLDDIMRGLAASPPPGTHPVDIFPSLSVFPGWFWGAKLNKAMAEMKSAFMKVNDGPFQRVKQDVVAGVAVPSMVSSMIREYMGADGLVTHEKDISGITGAALMAGADTTAATVDTFILAMALHPESQKKAQQEIDDFLHGERLPVMEDIDSLCYLQAIIKETTRWKPVAPLALTHSLTQDDEYNGMFLPVGTMVYPNIWSMAYNSQEYPNSTKFEPGRFIEEHDGHARLRKNVLDPTEFIFGFGRRICPGRHFAVKSVGITLATILTIFDISLPKDKDGLPIIPDLDYESGIVSHPKPFQCIFTPRSENLSKLLLHNLPE
ncbi:cytochrome P450 [Sistotremastrum niveocremeum HHB9708]|uniref:Cytochrome P450 n=1 Tax=Sistotremastrum niveocremeum HHB9708 TaxID=1314777 RepID=A0A164YR97_9AGAM|nr:cytochrome P450 [Sistotremastrum niveocremeum HHB9708]